MDSACVVIFFVSRTSTSFSTNTAGLDLPSSVSGSTRETSNSLGSGRFCSCGRNDALFQERAFGLDYAWWL